MQVVTTLSLSQVREETETAQAYSDVLINGKSTGVIIPGKVLDAAIRVDGHRYLLFVTDDVIFEELLTVLFIDTSQGIIDKVTIGGAYTTGHFENLAVSPHSVSFNFIGDTKWTIKVFASPKIKLPFTDPRGISRPRGVKKYIDIAHSPLNNL